MTLLDDLYVRSFTRGRQLALFYHKNDKEMDLIMRDTCIYTANLEVFYYRLSRGYANIADFPKYYTKCLQPFDYIFKISLDSLEKSKGQVTLDRYLHIFNPTIKTKAVPFSKDIVHYPNPLNQSKNLPDILNKYTK